MKNILIVFGTRPEVIKLSPIILALQKDNRYNAVVCNTEQQKELSNNTLNFFNIKANINLDVMSTNQTLSEVQSKILDRLSEVYSQNSIDATIVQGDTMTAFCGALSSFYNKVPVFHVEAGLRSNDLFEPFPEEAMRQMISRISNLNFTPTQLAYNALIKENIKESNIITTGNTVIDALYCLSDAILINAKEKLSKKGIVFNEKMVLITVHRRENHGERLNKILSAINQLANLYSDHQFILPVHPNPNVHDKVYSILSNIPNIILTEPMDYPELVYLMKNTKLVLTDSGGIQEEAPTFGNPVLVMRYETERVEGINAGFAKLVGADIEKIISETSYLLSQDMHKIRLDGSKNPYGDGKATERIIDSITRYLK